MISACKNSFFFEGSLQEQLEPQLKSRERPGPGAVTCRPTGPIRPSDQSSNGPVTPNWARASSRAHGRTRGLPTTRPLPISLPPSLPQSAACTTSSPLATRSSLHLTALLAAASPAAPKPPSSSPARDIAPLRRISSRHPSSIPGAVPGFRRQLYLGRYPYHRYYLYSILHTSAVLVL